jgi:DNA-binding NarL/FixJ family response regulator
MTITLTPPSAVKTDTKREILVLRHLAMGRSNSEAAATLRLSSNTVKS